MRRAVAGACALVAVGAVCYARVFSSPVDAATKAGEASVIVPEDGRAGAGQPLDSGNTRTPFSLKLPTGAVCRGDSANDGYRVQSYMVPSSVDPASLSFDSGGPAPQGTGANFRQPLYDTNSNGYTDAQTAAATKPPGPGPIVNIPAMNFAVYKTGDVPADTYNLGIACTRGPRSPTQLDTYWNVQLEVKAGLGSVGDTPVWVVVKPGTAGASSGLRSRGAGLSAGGASPGPPATTAGATSGVDATQRSAGAPSTAGRRARASVPDREAAPSGAPPSFHLPVTQLLPHVGMGAAMIALVVLAVAAAIALVARRNRYGERKWTGSALLPVISQEGR